MQRAKDWASIDSFVTMSIGKDLGKEIRGCVWKTEVWVQIRGTGNEVIEEGGVKFIAVALTAMDLESIILSDVSEIEEDIKTLWFLSWDIKNQQQEMNK